MRRNDPIVFRIPHPSHREEKVATIYYEQDANADLLKNKRVAILGYGSQGHAHALNLKDSGFDVVVGLYEGSKSWSRAEEAGLPVMTSADAVMSADVVMMLVPDHIQKRLYNESV